MISWKLASKRLEQYRKADDARAYNIIHALMMDALAPQEKRVYSHLSHYVASTTPFIAEDLGLTLKQVGTICTRLRERKLIDYKFVAHHIRNWRVR